MDVIAVAKATGEHKFGLVAMEFINKGETDEDSIQPRIATFTGTTDPVTRVLSWSGIPFDAFFAECEGNPLLLTVEGEFVIKNLVLLSAGMVVGATVSTSNRKGFRTTTREQLPEHADRQRRRNRVFRSVVADPCYRFD